MTQFWQSIEWFRPHEFTCRCGSCMGSDPEGVAELMHPESIIALDALRSYLGTRIDPTSGYRCPTYNARISSTGLAGPHTTGQAFDLDLNRVRGFRIMRVLEDLGFTGVGWQQKGDGRFVHLDTLPNAPGQPRPTVWSY